MHLEPLDHGVLHGVEVDGRGTAGAGAVGWSHPAGSTTTARDAAWAAGRKVSGSARTSLRSAAFTSGCRRRRRPGDEEQRPGLGGGEPAQVGAAAARQLPPAAAALAGVDRQAGHPERLEVAAGRPLRDLELGGHLGRRDLPARLEQQEDGHQPIGAHGTMIPGRTGHPLTGSGERSRSLSGKDRGVWHPGRVLQAHDVAIEVGGVTLVEGVSFAVRPRDKVGLVGRNGAGKTSLLKVLGGAADPLRGSVRVEGGLGYLPQDPRLDGVPDDVTALRHVLSGRGLDEALDRIEKLRIQVEEDPSERNIERFSRAEERFRLDGGYAAESEVRRLAAGLGLASDRLDEPLGVLSGGQRRRVELVRILFAGSDVLLLDEPTNHLDSDAKTWMLDFLRSYPGALLVISHDLDLLDEAITRVPAPRPRGRRRHRDDGRVQGHVLPVRVAARARRGPAGQADRPPGQGDRPPPDAGRPLRGQGDQGVDGPQPGEADRPPPARTPPTRPRPARS